MWRLDYKESWTIKKAEHWRIDAFGLCWRRLLRVPWTARRSNQSILKISPGCSLEGLMLKLKLQYFNHLMWKADSCWERLRAGEVDDRGWDGWMVTPTQWTWVWLESGSWWWTGRPGVLRFMELQRVAHEWATELNWTEQNRHATAAASFVSDSVWPHRRQPTRLLCSQDSLGKNTAVGCHFLLQQDRHNELQSLRNICFASLDFNFQNLYNSLFLSEWNLLSLVWLFLTPWT